MAIVQQFLFGSNREYYFIHVEQAGQNSFYSMYAFDSDGKMYVSFEDRRFLKDQISQQVVFLLIHQQL